MPTDGPRSNSSQTDDGIVGHSFVSNMPDAPGISKLIGQGVGPMGISRIGHGYVIGDSASIDVISIGPYKL